MSGIQLLDQATIDKIAAGEVVEKPASVVKELIENAIDAGASFVTIEIKEGGISLIRVTDNGTGIAETEIRKAFLRHATSKIASAEDLLRIKSLGFRGEALSSIAAVAQVEVITKTSSSLTGIRYCIEGGEEKELEEIGAPNGTTFLVRNLFFNTPVRRKFLKQAQTEGGYIADLVERMALSRPDISFKFINNGQTRFHTSGNQDLQEVVYRIYGRDITDALLPISIEKEGIQITGFLGKPEVNRATRSFETFFINGRYVKNDLLTRAVEDGYKQYLMQHKFPFLVLHFTIDTNRVDVNVHPTKMEVRFAGSAVIYEYVSQSIANLLHAQELIPNIELIEEQNKKTREAAEAKTPEPFEENRILQQKMDQQIKTLEYENQVADEFTYQEESQSETEKLLEMAAGSVRILGSTLSTAEMKKEISHSNIIKAKDQVIIERPVQLDLFEEKILTKESRADYRILGQIFETYWLVAFRDKLFIIDQHAAHEKVKYERFMKELEQKQVISQYINPPVIVTLTGNEERILTQYLSFFMDMGFEIEEFGTGSYAIRSVPADVYGCQEKELFCEFLDELSEGGVFGAPEVIRHKIASMSCKAAVKGNQRLEFAEVEKLIDELLTLDNPYHCPHGRPTIISMSKYEIEKKFKRIIS